MATSDLIAGLVLIIGGLFAAPGLVSGKNPEVDKLLKQIAPFMTYVGLFMLFYGFYTVYNVIRVFGFLVDISLPLTLTLVAMSILMLALGYLHSYSFIQGFTSKGAASEKSQEMFAHLNKKKASVGLAGVVVGVWWFIYYGMVF